MRLNVEVSFPWWAKFYIRLCITFGEIFNVIPDDEKITALLCRHAKLKIAKGE